MKEQLTLLIELQKLESATARVIAQQRDLPIRIAALEKEFQTRCDEVAAEEEQLEALKKRKREQDVLLQKGQDAIRKAKDKLGEVKNNKEYQSILKEIEAIEHKNGQLEEETIKLIDELDGREKGMKASREALEGHRGRFAEEKAQLEAELQSLTGSLEEGQQKSGALKQQIRPDMVRKFEQVKNAGRGVAVVPVWKEVCDGCHMKIPPQLYNELQKFKELHTCPNCSRIIYWENRNVKEG